MRSATVAVRETRTVTFAALRQLLPRAHLRGVTLTASETTRGAGWAAGAGTGVAAGGAVTPPPSTGGVTTITGQPSGVGAGWVGQWSSAPNLLSWSSSLPCG